MRQVDGRGIGKGPVGRRRRGVALAAGGLLIAASGCARQADDTVLVFAAASLTDAFAEIETAFEAEHPQFDLVFNFAGSSGLREQILSGAPADVFASANENTMATVVDSGDIIGPAVVFAGNELQIAVPTGNPASIVSLDDLADAALLVGLCAEGVPCGDLAATVLDRANVVASADTLEPDVRSLLTKVAAGELDVGLVYRTDVLADPAVEGIDIPQGVNAQSHYLIAALREAPNSEGSAAFVEFVESSGGQAILARSGFVAP